MSWIQFKALISPNQAEAMEESLMAADACSVTYEDAKDQPLLEPELGTTPLWEATIITGLFTADEDMAQAVTIASNVFKHLTQEKLPEYRIEILENQDWTRTWMEHFKPMQFGSRLWICPSWQEAPDKNAVNLLLDPGLAFGTGTHPTTALCLKWLDGQGGFLTNKSVIDYGCGSGILGIAAILLGASSVVGVDNDPQALVASNDNLLRNKLESSKLATYLPNDLPIIQADILLANILAQPLYELRDRLSHLTKAGGQIVLSGILEGQAADLRAYYEEHFVMEKVVIEDGWARLTGTKKD
ncbi:MAG: ribosomal protein L11 methyltransferase [Oleiphilaceae bacterium]|jgi:ribosomal protein L11 methyltransferase